MTTKQRGERRRLAVREVYFIRAEQSGLVKIGVANDAERRFAALQSGSPDRLSLLGIVVSDRAEALEEEIHVELRPDRAHGEWFHCSDAVAAVIRERALPPRFARFQYSRNELLRAGGMEAARVAQSLLLHPDCPETAKAAWAP